MPRFIVSRCWANAACRREAGVSREISVDWLGQKPAEPDALDRDQDECLPRLADEWEEPEADRLQHEPAAEGSRGPMRSITGPAGIPAASSAADETPTIRPAVPSENPRTSWR